MICTKVNFSSELPVVDFILFCLKEVFKGIFASNGCPQRSLSLKFRLYPVCTTHSELASRNDFQFH